MTASNHFDPIQNTGFSREMNSCDARRQLHVSAAAIVVIMAITAVAVIEMSGPPHGAYGPAAIELTVHAPQMVRVQQAVRAVS